MAKKNLASGQSVSAPSGGIDDSSAHYNYNPWEKFGFRWTKQERLEIERNLDRFMEKAGATYKVEKELLQRPDGSPSQGRFELIRSDNRKPIGTKTVSNRYEPLCPGDLAEALRPMVDQGWATPDAFFTMGEGAKEVLVACLDAQQIPGATDKVDGSERMWYVSLRNYHGLGQASGSLHSHRIICENTEAAACKLWAWKVRHSVGAADRMKEAVQAWEEVKEQIGNLVKRFRLFADFSLSEGQAKRATEDTLEMNQEAIKLRETPGTFFGKQVPGASTADIKLRDEILLAFNRPSKGTFGRSAMDLRNAVTDTLSHWTPEGSRVDERTIAERHLDIGGVRYNVEARADLVLAKLAGLELQTV